MLKVKKKIYKILMLEIYIYIYIYIYILIDEDKCNSYFSMWPFTF